MKEGRVLFRHELPQHVRQDAAVFERDELLGRVDARHNAELDRSPVAIAGMDGNGRSWLQTFRDAVNRVDLTAGEADGRSRLAALKLQRQDAHVDEVAPVNALEALGDDGLRAE